MTNEISQKSAIDMAYFKFALIAPVIQGIFPDPTKTAYYRRVTQNDFTLPDGKVFRYNPKTLEKWEAYYRKEGMDGLMPTQRSDAGTTRVINDTAISEIYRLKEKFPRINATLIYDKLIEDGFINQSEVSLSSVQRFIKRNDLRSARNPNQKDRKAFEEAYPTGMYQADTSYSCFINDNGRQRRTFLIQLVDDHSRLIVGSRFFFNDNAYNFQLVLKHAVSTYGICSKLYIDNGSPYTNEQLTLICGSLGIVEIHTPVRDGASKGKIERSFLTVKTSWLDGFDPSTVSSIDELNNLLADYVRKRNTSVNKSTGQTPIERYQNGILNMRVRVPKSKEWLDECFMNRVKRRVRLDSTVSIDTVSYDVPMQFIRSYVEIRYLPDHMQDAYIFFEGTHYPIRATNRVENGKTKRNNPNSSNSWPIGKKEAGSLPLANGLSIDYSAMGGSKNV